MSVAGWTNQVPRSCIFALILSPLELNTGERHQGRKPRSEASPIAPKNICLMCLYKAENFLQSPLTPVNFPADGQIPPTSLAEGGAGDSCIAPTVDSMQCSSSSSLVPPPLQALSPWLQEEPGQLKAVENLIRKTKPSKSKLVSLNSKRKSSSSLLVKQHESLKSSQEFKASINQSILLKSNCFPGAYSLKEPRGPVLRWVFQETGHLVDHSQLLAQQYPWPVATVLCA